MARIPRQAAANEVYRLPPKLFDARCRACWFVAAALALVVASFWSLDLQWARFLSAEAFARMGRFAEAAQAIERRQSAGIGKYQR